MINEQIRDREVRVIGPNGEQLGIMSAKEAYFKAKDAGLDLVKIAPTQNRRYAKLLTTASTAMSRLVKQKKQRRNRKPSRQKKSDFRQTLIPMI